MEGKDDFKPGETSGLERHFGPGYGSKAEMDAYIEAQKQMPGYKRTTFQVKYSFGDTVAGYIVKTYYGAE